MSKVSQIQADITKQLKVVKRNANKLSDVIQSLFDAIEASQFDTDDLKAVLVTFVTETGDIRGVNCDRILAYTKACLIGGSVSVTKTGDVKVRKHADADEFTFVTRDQSWDEFTRPASEKKSLTIEQASKRMSKLVTNITDDLDNTTAITILTEQLEALKAEAPLRIAS